MGRSRHASWLLFSGLPLWLACASATDESTGGAAGTGATGAGGSAAGGSTAGAGGSGAVGGGTGGSAAGGGGSGASGGGTGAAGGAGGSGGTGGEGAAAGSGGSGGVGVIDVSIFVANTCEVTTTPPSITVPMGTSFTVNWVNLGSSASPADVDKIDQYNQVPIVIGLGPGESYHDTIREWCGQLFTGIFWFRVTGCYEPTLLEVDCGG